MFETSTQLASTGSDSLVLYFVVGGVLLAAGIALMVFRALRRKGDQPGATLSETPEATQDERPQA